MAQSATAPRRCASPPPAPLPLEAAFDGGRLTSDGGLPWVGEAEAVLGVCARPGRGGARVAPRAGAALPGGAGAAAGLPDRLRLRGPERRHDAAPRPAAQAGLRAAARDGGRPGQPADPLPAGERGAGDLLLPPGRGPGRRLPPGAGAGRGARPGAAGPGRHRRPDPRQQEGTAYHGYFRQHMYHPLLVFDGDTDQLVTAVLRPGNAHGARGRRRRPQAPGARPARALAGGGRSSCGRTAASPCPPCTPSASAAGVAYTIGLVPNPRLEALRRAPAGRRPRRSRPRPGPRCAWPGRPATRPGPGPARGGWSTRPRPWPRARTPASSSPPGPTRPWPCTTATSTAGEPELWIKDLKRACFADRLCDHRFVANQFRLLLHAAAYWLLDTLRRWLVAAGAERLQLDTLRLRLLKIGGRVRELLTRVRLHLASSHPGQPLWALLAARPGRP